MASNRTFDRTVTVASANLFALASQVLGDATQWNRIAAMNLPPATLPDFMVYGPVTLKLPPTDPLAGNGGILGQ